MRNCIVVLNGANFTGTLNHGVKFAGASYEKLRVDYQDLLNFVVGDRNLLGAFVVSQNDTSKPKTPEQLQRNKKFLSGLKRFGWNISNIEYNGLECTPEQLVAPIWETALSPFIDEFKQFVFDVEQTDLVIITGSATWFDAATSFYETGLGVEIAYLQQATSKAYLSNFPFVDLTEFVVHSHTQLLTNKIPVENHVHATV